MTRRGFLCVFVPAAWFARVANSNWLLRVAWPRRQFLLCPEPASKPDLTFRANARLCSPN